MTTPSGGMPSGGDPLRRCAIAAIRAGNYRGAKQQRKINIMSQTEANKQLVLAVLKGAFIDRDPSVADRYFAPGYIQHNPSIPNGPAAIQGLIPTLAPDFVYEPGMAVAAGDLVMVHGRYTGWGPKPLVAVDIFRVADGKVVEHWDVMQEEVPASQTASGNAMFTQP
jgi:predicted SnoaL-like aldol condensation-catalyzing enzyme